MREIIAGIDIGTSKVAAIVGMIDSNGKIEILGKGIENCSGMSKGLIVDIEAVTNAISSSMKQAEVMSNIEVHSVFINIPSNQVELADNIIEIPLTGENVIINRGDLDGASEILKENIQIPHDRQLIDIIPQEYEVDDCEGIIDPVGMKGSVLKVRNTLVLGKNSVVYNITKALETSNFKLNSIVVDAYAAGETVLFQEEKEQGVIAIDVGGAATHVSIFKDNDLIDQQGVGLGGDSITKDLSIGLKIPMCEAEKIKREYELSLTKLFGIDQQISVFDISGEKKDIKVSDVAEIIEARAHELIRLSFEAFRNSGIKKSQINGVVLFGAGISYVDEIYDFTGRIFDLPVRVPLYKGMGEIKPEYLMAYGLVKYGATQARFQYIGKNLPEVEKESVIKDGLFKRFKDLFKP